jgi:hypothetical protein
MKPLNVHIDDVIVFLFRAVSHVKGRAAVDSAELSWDNQVEVKFSSNRGHYILAS